MQPIELLTYRDLPPSYVATDGTFSACPAVVACHKRVKGACLTGQLAKTVTTAAQLPDTERLEAADRLCHLPRLPAGVDLE
jgi:hypothetical protein